MDEGGQLKRQRQAALIAIILFITVLVGYLARVSISVALPFIKIDYGWNNEQLGSLGGLLLGIFLIGYGLSNIFLSPLLDCYGPRKGLLIAVTAWSILTFLTGIVGVYYSVFILLRFLLGIAQGVLFPSASKVTQAWFPPGRRSRMNALYHSSLELSNLLSPLLLIPLIMTINWQFMFVVLAAAGFIILIPIWLYLRDAPEPLPECERKGLVENLRLARDNLGEAVKIKGLFTLTLAHISISLVWWGVSLWLPTFLLYARGFTNDELVWAASAPYLGGLVGLYVGSWLSDKTGKRVLVTAIFCLTGALFLVVLAFTYNKLEVVAVLGMVIFSLSLMGPNAYALLQGVCTSKLTCSATGILNGLSNGVGFLGPIILGLVVAITGSYQLGLPIMAGFMVLGAVIVLRFRVLENPLYEQVMSPPVEK